jgi:hypothetical protein
MTYDIYAMFQEGAYLVATSNDQDHGMDTAERACKQLGQCPMAIATLTRGQHVLNCKIFTFNDLKNRKNRKN